MSRGEAPPLASSELSYRVQRRLLQADVINARNPGLSPHLEPDRPLNLSRPSGEETRPEELRVENRVGEAGMETGEREGERGEGRKSTRLGGRTDVRSAIRLR